MTKLHRLASIGAVIGFAGLTVGLLIDPKTAFASYLVAWTAISAVPIGALAVLFTAYLVITSTIRPCSSLAFNAFFLVVTL